MVVPFKLFTVWFNAKSTNLVQLLTANDHLVIQLRAAGLYVLVLIILCH
ncbi:unknown [Dialister sp. CAG:357]|nr:unknown [Dialister sp. CAG:357]